MGQKCHSQIFVNSQEASLYESMQVQSTASHLNVALSKLEEFVNHDYLQPTLLYICQRERPPLINYKY